MTKRQAVRLANAMAGLRPKIVRLFGPKWDAFGVEYSEVPQDLAETRVVGRAA